MKTVIFVAVFVVISYAVMVVSGVIYAIGLHRHTQDAIRKGYWAKFSERMEEFFDK